MVDCRVDGVVLGKANRPWLIGQDGGEAEEW